MTDDKDVFVVAFHKIFLPAVLFRLLNVFLYYGSVDTVFFDFVYIKFFAVLQGLFLLVKVMIIKNIGFF